MKDLARLLYYVLVWPFVAIGRELVDDVLVRAGLKYRPATGRARWRRRR
jgi:hypothetical protein